MFRRYSIAAFWLLFCLSACSLLPGGDNVVSPAKSDFDKREYRYITLPNELRVLLVSDAEAEKSAAALDVMVGSAQDPQRYPGLAHFLEHMLFLGTEAFPDADDYLDYISSHGGGHNAYTAFEHTNYFFDINPEFYNGALQRFAAFFTSPLFNAEYVEREKNAVHSEYLAKIRNDQRRSLDALKEVVNPQHPFAGFSVGNLEVFNRYGDQALRQALLDFYQQYYSANQMTLVLVGPQSLAQLQQLALENFSAIANNQRQTTAISTPLFAADALPMQLTVEPVQQQRVLTLTFPVDDVQSVAAVKPLVYLGNIIGHEGEGSLLSYLKAKGWVEQLSAGTGILYHGGASFNVTMQLSEQGLQQIDAIMQAFFTITGQIQQQQIPIELYREQQALTAMQFRFQEPRPPINTASYLAHEMHYYAAENVLRGGVTMQDYDRSVIGRFLADINPENMLMTLMAPGVDTDRQSNYYQTPYAVSAITAEQIAHWSAPQALTGLHLPAPNQFIAEDFSIVDGASKTQPQLLVEQAGFRLWFENDQRFNLPKGKLYMSLDSPLAADSADNAVKLAMLQQLVNDQLNEFVYPAWLAGLEFSLSAGWQGLTLSVSGFNDKQPVLFQQFVQVLAKPAFDPARFELLKQDLLRRYSNQQRKPPYQRVVAGLQQQLYLQRWSDQALMAALEKLQLAAVQDYHQQFFQQQQTRLLMYGNYSPATARALAAVVQQGLPACSDVDSSLQVLQLEPAQLRYQVDAEHDDSSLLLYVQAGETGYQARVAMGLAGQILQAPFYSQLRTDQQLGYIVNSGVYPIRDVAGIYFLVQSPVADAQALQQAVDMFLQQQLQQLQALSPEQFAKERQVLLQLLREQPKTIAEQTDQYWQDLQQGVLDFSSRQQLIDALQTLDQSQWLRLVESSLAASSRRALWLYHPGQWPDKGLQNPPLDAESSRYFHFPR